MKYRIGLISGFVVGYALGSAVSRERASQLARMAGRAGQSVPLSTTAALVGTKAKAVATLGVERAKDTIGVRLGWRDGDQAADAITVDLAADLALAINSRSTNSRAIYRPSTVARVSAPHTALHASSR